MKDSQIIKAILRKKKEAGGITLLALNHIQSDNNENTIILAGGKRHTDPTVGGYQREGGEEGNKR